VYTACSTDRLERCACSPGEQNWHYHGALSGTHEEAGKLTITGKPTLDVPTKTTLRAATAHQLYDILISQKFQPPTALAPDGIWHSLLLTEEGSDIEQRKEMKHILACTRSPWLSRRQQQTLYMVATDSVPIGYKVGESGTLRHALVDSPLATAFWDMILSKWCNTTVGQDGWVAPLLPGANTVELERALILGERPSGLDDNDEQWHVLRAIAIDALLRQHAAAAARARSGQAAITTTQAAEAAYDECRRDIQKIITHSHKRARDLVSSNKSRPHVIGARRRLAPTPWRAAARVSARA